MKQSDCESICYLLSPYIDNMLSDEESDIVREHIANCASCREELAMMQSIQTVTKQLPDIEVSADFHKNLMEKIKAEGKTEKRYAIPWKKAAGFVAAAAVVALSVVSFLRIDKDPGNENLDAYLASPTPQAEETVSSSPRLTEERNTAERTSDAEAEQPVKDQKTDKVPPDKQAEKSVPQQKKADEPVLNNAHETADHMPFAIARSGETDGVSAYSDEAESLPGQDRSALQDSAEAHAAAEAGIVSDARMVSEPAYDPQEETNASSEINTAKEQTSVADEKPSSGGGGSASGSATKSSAGTYLVATVSVSENAKEEAIAVLSAYAKDVNGYQVGASLQSVLKKLSALDGYLVSCVNTERIQANYIVLK